MASERVGLDDVRHLTVSQDECPDRFLGELLLYDGEETFWMADRVLATTSWKVI